MAKSANRGFSTLPISLVICVFIASLAVTIGIRGVNRARSMREDQRIFANFEEFVRISKQVSYGMVGDTRRVKLELGPFRIKINKGLAELKRSGEVLRADYLPLPMEVRVNEENIVSSGVYRVELVCTSSSFFSPDECDLELVLKEG